MLSSKKNGRMALSPLSFITTSWTEQGCFEHSTCAWFTNPRHPVIPLRSWCLGYVFRGPDTKPQEVFGCIGKYQNHFVTTVPIKPGLSCGRSQLQRILQRPFQHPIGRQRFKPKKQQRKNQVEYFGSVVVLWYCTSLQIGFKHDAFDGILFVSVGRLQFLTNDHLKWNQVNIKSSNKNKQILGSLELLFSKVCVCVCFRNVYIKKIFVAVLFSAITTFSLTGAARKETPKWKPGIIWSSHSWEHDACSPGMTWRVLSQLIKIDGVVSNTLPTWSYIWISYVYLGAMWPHMLLSKLASSTTRPLRPASQPRYQQPAVTVTSPSIHLTTMYPPGN